MVMSTPQLLARKTNGGATDGQSSNDAPKTPKAKAPPEGEKVVIRRLPPGMTEEEFVNILGDEWKVGGPKVDWFSYFPGKVSRQSVPRSAIPFCFVFFYFNLSYFPICNCLCAGAHLLSV